MHIHFVNISIIFAAQCYAQEWPMPSCAVRLSVRLSVKFVHCVKTNNHIFDFQDGGSQPLWISGVQ